MEYSNDVVKSIQLTFNWNPVTTMCSVLQYAIVATDCGECPRLTTFNTATCVVTNVTATERYCRFNIEVLIYGIAAGETSSESTAVIALKREYLI